MNSRKSPSYATLVFGGIGSLLEWYDFALFGLLAPHLGKAFFPSNSPALELMKSFGVFAVAFVMRPVGGALLGIAGDRIGRKKIVHLCIIMMIISTTAVGALPTFNQGGLIGPILLILCRMIQGMSVGGQLPGTMILITESQPENQRASSFAVAAGAGGIGSIGAAIVVAILHEVLSREDINEWGWRLCFFTSIIASPVVCYLEKSVQESTDFELVAQEAAKNQDAANHISLAQAFHLYPFPILQIFSISAIAGCNVYNVNVWIPSYLYEQHDPPIDRAYLLISIASGCALPLLLVCARVVDQYGHFKMLPLGISLVAALTLPLFAALEQSGIPMILALQFSIMVAHQMMWSTVASWMPFLAPVNARFTVVSIGFNASMGFFGGAMPLISTALTQKFGTTIAPGFFQLMVATLSLVFAVHLSFKKQDGEKEEEEEEEDEEENEEPCSDNLILQKRSNVDEDFGKFEKFGALAA